MWQEFPASWSLGMGVRREECWITDSRNSEELPRRDAHEGSANEKFFLQTGRRPGAPMDTVSEG